MKRYEVKRRERTEDPGFILVGVRDQDGELVPEEHPFTCRRELTAGELIDYVERLSLQPMVARRDFIASALAGDEERARWEELLYDRQFLVDPPTVREIADDLLEEYAARPTNGPADSSAGPASNGESSTASSPSGASTG